MRDVITLNHIIKHFTAEFFAINNITFLFAHMRDFNNNDWLFVRGRNIKLTIADRFLVIAFTSSFPKFRLGENVSRAVRDTPERTEWDKRLGGRCRGLNKIGTGLCSPRNTWSCFPCLYYRENRELTGIISSLRRCNRSGNEVRFF